MEKYKFGLAFQKNILALSAQEDDFIAKYRDVLNPNFFENEVVRFIFQIILTHWDKYRVVPQRDTLGHLLLEFQDKLSSNQLDEMNGVLFQIFNDLITDRQFVIDQVVGFGQRQAVKLALQKSIAVLKDDQPLSKIREYIDSALVLGSSRDIGLDFADAVLQIPHYLKNDRIYDRIPTPWDRVNRSLLGGCGPGELLFATGGPKYGKSTLLVELTATAVLLGYPVVYYSLELKELDVLIRLACRLFNLTATQLINNFSDCLPLIKTHLIDKNLLRIKFFPTKSVNVEGLRTHLNYTGSSTGFKAKIIVVDYADRLGYAGVDAYTGLGTVYDDLIRVGTDKEALVATVSQMGRSGYRAQDSEIEAIADSWLKFANADLAMVMRQTKDERLAGLVRLYIAGARRGPDSYEVPCAIDYEKYSVREIPEETYYSLLGTPRGN